MGKIYTIEELADILSPIAQQYGIYRVCLFGSYARGEADEKSDIDLLIEGGRIRGAFALARLYDELENAFGKSVDLVTAEGMNHKANREHNGRFRKNVGEDGKIIYEASIEKD